MYSLNFWCNSERFQKKLTFWHQRGTMGREREREWRGKERDTCTRELAHIFWKQSKNRKKKSRTPYDSACKVTLLGSFLNQLILFNFTKRKNMKFSEFCARVPAENFPKKNNLGYITSDCCVRLTSDFHS